MIWQDHLRKTLLDMKLKESVTLPWVFQHETRDILLCVHVDDLLCTGVRDDLLWLKLQMLMEYELETKLVGDHDDMEKTAVYLGRTLEWSEDGLVCSARSETCALTVARAGYGNVSECVHAAESHSGKRRRSE